MVISSDLANPSSVEHLFSVFVEPGWCTVNLLAPKNYVYNTEFTVGIGSYVELYGVTNDYCPFLITLLDQNGVALNPSMFFV